MDSQHYHENAQKTEAPVEEALRRFLGAPRYEQVRVFRLLHAVLGIASEMGELADQMKRHLYYGKPLDLVNMAEELGDVEWYLPLGADALGLTLGHLMRSNLAKLKNRYPEKFTADASDERNTALERLILEQHVDAPEEGDNPELAKGLEQARNGEFVEGPTAQEILEDSLDGDLTSLQEAPESLDCSGCGRMLEGTWLWCPSCATPIPATPAPRQTDPVSDQHPTLPGCGGDNLSDDEDEGDNYDPRTMTSRC